MVNDGAFGVLTASSGTGVLALVSHAHFIGWTIGVNHALGSTAYVRIANVFRRAIANADTVSFSAQSVRAACTLRAGRGFWIAN